MAIHDPCALLHRLLLEPTESGWIEFKMNNADPETIGAYVSALANGAMLAERDRAFLVFGVRDADRSPVGTTVRLSKARKGNENLHNWLGRMIEPRLTIDLLDFECDGRSFSVVCIEPSYDRPVRFAGTEYIRVGENVRKLAEFPERERALWLATGRRKFEHAVALSNQTLDQVLERLDVEGFYELSGLPKPASPEETLRRLVEHQYLIDNLEGRFDITNLGAILLARDLGVFPSVASKGLRIIKYVGRDKSSSDFEQHSAVGYAVGFASVMKTLTGRLPSQETYIEGRRRLVSVYPDTAIREVLANALIHQDFTITGAGPVVEIYENRIEVSNPGNSLIPTDRIIDERRSRNERLAAAMRAFGLCEERGGGLDKSLIEIERVHLPAPEFVSSEHGMRVVLFGPKSFAAMTKAERVRAAFFHCVLRWLMHDYMSNATLRDRFSLPQEDYQAVSALIAEAVRLGRIAPADPNQGRKNARYVPYWAA